MRRWAVVIVAWVVLTVAFGVATLPSAALFAALVVGIVHSLLSRREELRIPPLGMAIGQAIIGVALGLQIQAATLRVVASSWFAVLAVTLATLFLSLGIGLLLARHAGLSPATGALGSVAGGASGIVAAADELGADARLVAFMQYLRVLVVVVVAPLAAYALFKHGGHALPATREGPAAGLWLDLAVLIGCGVVGALVARSLRIPAGSLLGPLVVASALSIAGVVDGVRVPTLVQDIGFGLIGLQVGLRFTADTIRQVGRLMPLVLGSIFVLIVGCAALAALLVPLAHVSYADAYLATTPGGLYAVLAASIGVGANSTFVVSVQLARLFVVILTAPLIVRLLNRRAASVPEGT